MGAIFTAVEESSLSIEMISEIRSARRNRITTQKAGIRQRMAKCREFDDGNALFDCSDDTVVV